MNRSVFVVMAGLVPAISIRMAQLCPSKRDRRITDYDYGDTLLFPRFIDLFFLIRSAMARLARIVVPGLPHHVT